MIDGMQTNININAALAYNYHIITSTISEAPYDRKYANQYEY